MVFFFIHNFRVGAVYFVWNSKMNVYHDFYLNWTCKKKKLTPEMNAAENKCLIQVTSYSSDYFLLNSVFSHLPIVICIKWVSQLLWFSSLICTLHEELVYLGLMSQDDCITYFFIFKFISHLCVEGNVSWRVTSTV